MQVKIRVSGETHEGRSTWSELWITAEKPWICLTTDAAGGFITGLSLTPAAAREAAEALLRAADLAEREEDFPP